MESARGELGQMHLEADRDHMQEARELQEEYEARIQDRERQLAELKQALHNQERTGSSKVPSISWLMA